MDRLLKRIDELTDQQAAAVLTVIGFITFCKGLLSPFQGDDLYQIVHNTAAHSLVHIASFFQSGTFYDGQRMAGHTYSPLTTTLYALLFGMFGAHPVLFHIVQLGLYIGSAILFYLFVRQFFNAGLALAVASLFIVHPLNSQVVYYIPNMQDALFFFFGILSLWLLSHIKTRLGLVYAVGCLLLSLCAKEAGFLFMFTAFSYVLLFNRQRLREFLLLLIVPTALYVAAKIHAVGLFTHAVGMQPKIGLVERLLTTPSIILFYVTRLVLPWKLATGHYWLTHTFSVKHVLLPLLYVTALLASIIYGLLRIARLHREVLPVFIFFTVWTVLGLLPYLHLVPSESIVMTAYEPWAYFWLAGVLGMLATIWQTVEIDLPPSWYLMGIALIAFGFVISDVHRASAYKSQYSLAVHDIGVSKDNYQAINAAAQEMIRENDNTTAANLAQQSIAIYPYLSNYQSLGIAKQQLGDVRAAKKAYQSALQYGSLDLIYENLAQLSLETSSYKASDRFITQALVLYPHDFKLWVFLALVRDAEGNNAAAKTAIKNAARYGQPPKTLVTAINKNQPFSLNLPNTTTPLVVH